MTRKSILITILVVVIVLIALVYVASVIDTRKITTQADVESTASAQTLTELPSPDQSTLTKIYTSIVNLFK